ncbi:uncharacterized protein NECHADRAFT_48505 [Fusarium vanettenii 77-13-4]|uniref:Uncharacterized protein n=1 Tax=Fusarium vanettenii (strain ATCC MYA-4622 / CBS 123669 / FGSC 9596 / NRRL 45880 / 77-13-4) TaxID=660122 RepID=C7YU64_FUSV7|nr:uncharacterized protein NECHADRAFT_48505 [Fusarium vanettenii 77-13-4]EEU44360.1 hypothetical protein NECHADRAFT_48505 [Fusarium vanettenii 77-13-4]
MGMQGPLTAQALGRSPYDDVVEWDGDQDDEQNDGSRQQQYDHRGRPINPETKRINRDIIRSHNEVMLVIGVAEQENPTSNPEAESERRHSLYEYDVGMNLTFSAMRCVDAAGAFGLDGLRQRILIYKRYSHIAFWDLFAQARKDFSFTRDIMPGAATSILTNYTDRKLFWLWRDRPDRMFARRFRGLPYSRSTTSQWPFNPVRPTMDRGCMHLGNAFPSLGNDTETDSDRDRADNTHSRSATNDVSPLRAVDGQVPNDTGPVEAVRRPSTFSMRDDFSDEDENEGANATLISFDVEATEASSDGPQGLWSAELRPSVNDARGLSSPSYVDTLLTQLPPLLANYIFSEAAIRILTAPYESMSLRLLARTFRLRLGLPSHDIFNVNLFSGLNSTLVINFLSSQFIHLVLCSELWAGFATVSELLHTTPEEWREAEDQKGDEWRED